MRSGVLLSRSYDIIFLDRRRLFFLPFSFPLFVLGSLLLLGTVQV